MYCTGTEVLYFDLFSPVFLLQYSLLRFLTSSVIWNTLCSLSSWPNQVLICSGFVMWHYHFPYGSLSLCLHFLLSVSLACCFKPWNGTDAFLFSSLSVLYSTNALYPFQLPYTAHTMHQSCFLSLYIPSLSLSWWWLCFMVLFFWHGLLGVWTEGLQRVRGSLGKMSLVSEVFRVYDRP